MPFVTSAAAAAERGFMQMSTTEVAAGTAGREYMAMPGGADACALSWPSLGLAAFETIVMLAQPMWRREAAIEGVCGLFDVVAENSRLSVARGMV